MSWLCASRPHPVIIAPLPGLPWCLAAFYGPQSLFLKIQLAVIGSSWRRGCPSILEKPGGPQVPKGSPRETITAAGAPHRHPRHRLGLSPRPPQMLCICTVAQPSGVRGLRHGTWWLTTSKVSAGSGGPGLLREWARGHREHVSPRPRAALGNGLVLPHCRGLPR